MTMNYAHVDALGQVDGFAGANPDESDGWYPIDWSQPICAGYERLVHTGYALDGAVVRPTYTRQVLTVAEYRALIVSAADAIAMRLRDAVTAQVSPAEMASWPIKREEALAYQAMGAAAAPNLAMEAAGRGVGLAALVDKVLAKAASLSALEAAIAGRCGAIQDAATAATDLQSLEVVHIGIETGWPL
jgi:hypothetical protein